MEPKTKVGLFGYGYWGKTYHRVISEIEGVEISYICDANDRIKDQIPLGIKFFNDPQKAIDDGGAEAIFIITPAGTHRDIATHALRNGLDTFVEKPAILSSNDLNTVLIHKQRRSVFFPGHIYAYNDMVKSLAKSLKPSEEDIVSTTSSRMALGPVRNDVGCIWDLLPHDLTIFDILGFGRPVAVSCTGQYPLKLIHEDIAHANIHYLSGLDVSVELSWIFPKKIRQTSIVTEKSLFIFDETSYDMPLGVIRFKGNIPESVNEIIYNRLPQAHYFEKISYSAAEPLKNMIQSFLDAVKSENTRGDTDEIRRAKIIIPTIEAALASMANDGEKVNIRYE